MPHRIDDHAPRGTDSLFTGWSSLPNLVTYARIILVAALIVCTIKAGPRGADSIPMRWAAFILFAIAAYTDRLDGWLARRNGEVTELGKLLDPIADKLLICGTLVIVSAFDELDWWITILFLIREIGITVLRLFVIDARHTVIPASRPGKLKTLAECVGIGMMLAPVHAIAWVPSEVVRAYEATTFAVIIVALALCLYSGAEYIRGLSHERERG